jgi:histidine triad (HIT) family protein
MRTLLFRLSKTRFAGLVIGWIFAHMSFIIPVNRLHETETLLAFYHPKPSYPVHILIVPKKARRELKNLTHADSDFMIDLFATVQTLVADLDLEQTGYRLICNGGAYQDVPQLHFHLVSG